ncbi:MAG: cytochrome c family protein, partial [Pirellulales bacterium]|nr:cytochrome c family protein [Pirellulales bacterium]
PLVLVATAAAQEAVSQETVDQHHANLTIVDATRIEGHALCVDCHKLEVQAWMASKHATRAFDLLRTAPTARQYAQKLGVRQIDIASKSICVNCHATPMTDAQGHRSVLSGVSCESCHNAAGGEDGWLNRHAVYGPRGTVRGRETEAHYRQRVAFAESAGQLRSENLYQLAKRCFQCHVVSDEKIVAAGHDHGDGFELVEKMQGEVRHNFFLDASANAEVSTLWRDSLHHGLGRTAAGRMRVAFLTGQLVDLETSLRSLATATEENDFADLMIERVEDAYELLAEDLLEELEETKIPEIERAVQAARVAYEKLDEDGFSPRDATIYLEAARQIGLEAEDFSRRDGNALKEMDDLELLPEGPFRGAFEP